VNVPLPGVTTVTGPVGAPAGTVVGINVAEATVKVAAVPLKLTLVVPVRSVPRIMTAVFTEPEVGTVSTKGPRPTDKLKTVPQPDEVWPHPLPPEKVVP